MSVCTIQAWVARDKHGSLCAYTGRPPIRTNIQWECTPDIGLEVSTDFFSLPKQAFPDIKWEDEPLLVEVGVAKCR